MGINDFSLSSPSRDEKDRLDLANFDLLFFEWRGTSLRSENQIYSHWNTSPIDHPVSLSQWEFLPLNVSEIDWNNLTDQELWILSDKQVSKIPNNRLLKIVDKDLILDIVIKLLDNEYEIINAKTLRKQLRKFLRDVGKKAFFEALFCSNLNDLHIKDVGALAIEFGKNGYRILLEMRNSELPWKVEYWIDGLYNHKDYINRLKEKKR